MHLAYLHLTDPRLTHAAFRASANGCVPECLPQSVHMFGVIVCMCVYAGVYIRLRVKLTFKTSTPHVVTTSYNMLLWRMCRLFMRLRETAMGAAASQDPNAPVTGTHACTRSFLKHVHAR